MNEVEDNLKETDQRRKKPLRTRKKKKITAVKPTQPTELTFWDHLDELRKTIIHIACAVIVLMLLAFCLRKNFFGLILCSQRGRLLYLPFLCVVRKDTAYSRTGSGSFAGKTYQHATFRTVSHPHECFVLCGYSAGFSLHTLSAFSFYFSPALYQNEKKYSRWLIFWGYLLFLTGSTIQLFPDIPFHIPLPFDLSSESGSGKYHSAQFLY